MAQQNQYQASKNYLINEKLVTTLEYPTILNIRCFTHPCRQAHVLEATTQQNKFLSIYPSGKKIPNPYSRII